MPVVIHTRHIAPNEHGTPIDSHVAAGMPDAGMSSQAANRGTHNTGDFASHALKAWRWLPPVLADGPATPRWGTGANEGSGPNASCMGVRRLRLLQSEADNVRFMVPQGHDQTQRAAQPCKWESSQPQGCGEGTSDIKDRS
jgi:hypothetical protein